MNPLDEEFSIRLDVIWADTSYITQSGGELRESVILAEKGEHLSELVTMTIHALKEQIGVVFVKEGRI